MNQSGANYDISIWLSYDITTWFLHDLMLILGTYGMVLRWFVFQVLLYFYG
ncbi:hypothetical protein KY49_6840 [Burkholderia sp. MSHR3999]|uniref:hypothetical protein n=1 Tax=Burkholderia sp. MSHR3999 TaxID=1542965 RepID=UPI0005B6E7FB|nr:hypothetical protein [Burkholderia sp. MSHR3999]KIP17329.1 hypothetical protein KY49_6840 [Burkholderia sp. MSHR3999]